MPFRQSRIFTIILHLLLPGLGHVYWREYLFGVFIFLVSLIAEILFVASYFIHLSLWARLLLLGLPLLFYVFTFVDLLRTMSVRAKRPGRGKHAAMVFAGAGVLYQLAAPIAPASFAITNAPEVFQIRDSALAPRFAAGDLLKASSLAYTVNLYIFESPVWYALPERFDMVRFTGEDDRPECGVVIGLPGESVEIVDGAVVTNGIPELTPRPAGISLNGEWPLTYSGDFSIIVATLNLGVVDSVVVVPLGNVRGKVSRFP